MNTNKHHPLNYLYANANLENSLNLKKWLGEQK